MEGRDWSSNGTQGQEAHADNVGEYDGADFKNKELLLQLLNKNTKLTSRVL